VGGSKIHLVGQAFAGSQGRGVIADSMEEPPSFRNHGGLGNGSTAIANFCNSFPYFFGLFTEWG
jgi:hypothetical protein